MSAPAPHPRRLDVPGTTNFRDLGGLATADGCRHTKWGLIYRTDALTSVSTDTARDILVDKLHIHHTFDLRNAREVADKNYSFQGIHHHLPSADPKFVNHWDVQGRVFTPELTAELMAQNYRERVDNHTSAYEAIFRFIIDVVCAKELERLSASAGPGVREAAVFHCTAGKDRTGWMAAMLLHALDVPFDTILEDFMLTNKYLVRPADASNYMGGLGMDEACMKVLWTVDERFMRMAFDYVEEKYGGMDAYLRNQVHLSEEDLRVLREALLE